MFFVLTIGSLCWWYDSTLEVVKDDDVEDDDDGVGENYEGMSVTQYGLIIVADNFAFHY